MLSLIGPHSDLTMLLLWNYPLWMLHEEGCPQGDMCSNFGTEVTKLENIHGFAVSSSLQSHLIAFVIAGHAELFTHTVVICMQCC